MTHWTTMHLCILSSIAVIGFAVLASGLVCPFGWIGSSSGPSCFKFVSDRSALPWKDARIACSKYQADLAIIDTEVERGWLYANLRAIQHRDSSTQEWWVGGTDLLGADGVWRWIDNTTIDAAIAKWRKGEPNNWDGNEHCVQLWGGALNDHDCIRPMPYVCERHAGVPVKCYSGWEEMGDQCVAFVKMPKSWSDAQDQCALYDSNLVTVPDAETQSHLFYTIKEMRMTDVWIGLYLKEKDDDKELWSWTNSSVGFKDAFWIKGEPMFDQSKSNETCAQITSLSDKPLTSWSTAWCGVEKPFICQMPQGVCADGWVQHKRLCYQFNSRAALPWYTADEFCKAQGGNLVEFTHESVQVFISDYLPQLREAGLQDIWIGLTDNNTDRFKWSSGRPTNRWSHWAHGQVNTKSVQDCGYIITNDKFGRWHTTPECTRPSPFICESLVNAPIADVTMPRLNYICPDGWSVFDDHCYIVTIQTLNWLEAKSFCEEKGGHLATIINGRVQTFLNSKIAVYTWIGLTDRSMEGRYVWTDGTLLSVYTNWDSVEPDDKYGEENCVAMTARSGKRGKWHDERCQRKFGVVCQLKALNAVTRPPVPTESSTQFWFNPECGSGWEMSTSTGFCYSYLETRLTWTDAEEWCIHHGGHLLSINTQQEESYITGRLIRASLLGMWIGAKTVASIGKYKWSDRSPWVYINWAPGQPKYSSTVDMCGLLILTKSNWFDVKCSNRNGFICKKIPKYNSTVASTTSASTRLSVGSTRGCLRTWLSYRKSCYFIKHHNVTWRDALQGCRRLGGDLVSIQEPFEELFIKSKLGRSDPAYWIGLHDRNEQGVFQWSDGSKAIYTAWGRHQPIKQDRKEHCVRMYPSGWFDSACDDSESAYICEMAQSVIAKGAHMAGCPRGAFEYYGRCYEFIEHAENWTLAQQYCHDNGGDLAIIYDRYVQSFLTSEIVGRKGIYWVGLKLANASSGQWTWINGLPLNFTSWDRNFAIKKHGATCVAMGTERPSGFWKLVDCSTQTNFICQRYREGYTPPTIPTKIVQSTVQSAPCPTKWIENPSNGYCYKVFYQYARQDRMSWMGSEDNCKQHGAHLVSFHGNGSEDTFVRKSVLQWYESGEFWIGLSSIDDTKGFTWTDDSPVDYTHWSPGEPNNHNRQEECVSFNTHYYAWTDAICTLARNWICKGRKGVVAEVEDKSFSNRTNSTMCAKRGGSTWYSFANSCYYISSYVRKTWYEARRWCRDKGGDLLSVHIHKESEFVLNKISKATEAIFWIGLNELGASGYIWSDGTVIDFKPNWAAGEPSDFLDGQKCGSIYGSNGHWFDQNCGDKNGFICKVAEPSNTNTDSLTPKPSTPAPIVGGCRHGFHQFRNKCIWFSSDSRATAMRWTDARKSCQMHGKDATLASIGNEIEQAFITSLVKGRGTDLWIGFNDLIAEGHFTWSDNTENTYTNWAVGKPRPLQSQEGGSSNNDCVEMLVREKGAGKWSDQDCSRKRAYICQDHTDKLFPTAPRTTASKVCDDGYAEYEHRCYRVIQMTRSWSRAREICQQNGDELVTVNTIYVNAFLVQLIQNIKKPAWIGLRKNETVGTFTWTDNVRPGFTNWSPRMLANGSVTGDCVAIANGQWIGSHCQEPRPAICENASEEQIQFFCPEGWMKHRESCYMAKKYDGKLSSYEKGRLDCIHMGAHLATISSESENAFILSTFEDWLSPSTDRDGYFIGLDDRENEGVMRWVTGEELKFKVWLDGKPARNYHDGGDCALLLASGEWNNVNCECTTEYCKGYVCETSAIVIARNTSSDSISSPVTSPAGTVKHISTRRITLPQLACPGCPRYGDTTDTGPIPVIHAAVASTSPGKVAGLIIACIIVLLIILAVLIYLRQHRQFAVRKGCNIDTTDRSGLVFGSDAVYRRTTDDISVSTLTSVDSAEGEDSSELL